MVNHLVQVVMNERVLVAKLPERENLNKPYHLFLPSFANMKSNVGFLWNSMECLNKHEQTFLIS